MRALIADDDPVLRHGLSRQLTKWGFEAETFTTGLELRAALMVSDGPRLAVIDWNMPGVDGLTLCREIRNTPGHNSVHIILLTANGDKRDVVAGLNSGADDYIVKPFEWDELKARVRIGARTLKLQGMLGDRVRELEAAMARVRQLSGLLPICSYCKSIRDDKDYWQQLETYLLEHTEATLSHGICPPCFDRLAKSYDIDQPLDLAP